nr:uncharacterized protein LOC124808375 [Hydra vulgaris]
MAKKTEFSLPDALDRFGLPISVTTSKKCQLNGGFVFEAGTNFTVLQRERIQLLFGTDWNGNIFRLNTRQKADLYVDILDEIYPTDLMDIISFFPNISYILSKFSHDKEFYRLDEQNETFKDLNHIALISSTGQTFYYSLKSLLNKNLFVFVYRKETTSLEVLLSRKSFAGTKVRFITGLEGQVPSGNVVLDGLYVYDSVLTVTTPKNYPNKLLYEMFQLDSNIAVFISNEREPLHLVGFGEYGSREYIIKIAEIIFSIHFEIYTPIFYGQLLTDFLFVNQVKNDSYSDTVCEFDTTQVPISKINNNLLEIKKDIDKIIAFKPSPLRLQSTPDKLTLESKSKLEKSISSLNSSFLNQRALIQPFCLNNDDDDDDVFKNSDNEDEISLGQVERTERANRRKSSYIKMKSESFDLIKVKKEKLTDSNGFNQFSEAYEKASENSFYGYDTFYQALKQKDKDTSKSGVFYNKTFENNVTQPIFPVLHHINTFDNSLFENMNKTTDLHCSSNIIHSGINSLGEKSCKTKSKNDAMKKIAESKKKKKMKLFAAKKKTLNKTVSKSDSCIPQCIENENFLNTHLNFTRSSNDLNISSMSVANKKQKTLNKTLSKSDSCVPQHIDKEKSLYTCLNDCRLSNDISTAYTSVSTKKKISLNKTLSKSDSCIPQCIDNENSLYTCLNMPRLSNGISTAYSSFASEKKKSLSKMLSKSDSCIPDCIDKKRSLYTFLNFLISNNKKKIKKQLSKSDTCIPNNVENIEKFYAFVKSSRSTDDVSSGSYNAVKLNNVSNESQREIESLKDIFRCSIEDIGNRLHGLKLGKFVKKFKQQMINGKLLERLSEEALREIGLTHFEARKLYKYVHGWRVKTVSFSNNLENSRVTDWSVNDVKKIMKKIKLNRLGAFADENLIDGVLLEDLIRHNFIKTLDKDHGIRLTLVEFERLRSYVYDELRYLPQEVA